MNKSMTLESVATVKFTKLKEKPKKVYSPAPKLPPFDHIAAGIALPADAVKEVESTLEMGSSLFFSRPASPFPTLQPQRQTKSPQSPFSAIFAAQVPLPASPSVFSELADSDLPPMNDNFEPCLSITEKSSVRPRCISFSTRTSAKSTVDLFPRARNDSELSAGLTPQASCEPKATQEICNPETKYERVESAQSTTEQPVQEDSKSQSSQERETDAMSEITRAYGRPKIFDASSSVIKVGEDAFDSLDWDPDLASGNGIDEAESPEPVAVAPRLVAYTTVGSLVDPNAVTQIAPPNRIQRESVNRRPFMSAPQGRHDSYYQTRAQLPSLNMSNNMQYAQQFSSSPHHLPYGQAPTPNSGRPPHAARSTQQTQSSLDNERFFLTRLENTTNQLSSSQPTPQPFGHGTQMARGHDTINGFHEQSLGQDSSGLSTRSKTM
jgi:hypothetical protein